MVINSHATPLDLEFANKNRVKKLKKKNIKRLILLGCNAGHIGYIFNNIAYEFRRKIKGPVVASDGTVSSYSDIECSETSLFTSLGDDEWKSWRTAKKNKRKENDGWIVYKNSLTMIYENVKEATILDMCSW